MADTATAPQQHVHRYRSTTGIDYDSVPFRLWERSKELFWDPATIDFTRDARDWAGMTDDQRLMIAGSAVGFMVGEEGVTLDILPLLRAICDEGRLEETMYLSMFAMEEAKHVDFFRRWFDAVGFDPRTLRPAGADGYGSNGDAPSGDVFGGALTRVMRRLDNDRSPERFLDASLLYNQLIEAVAAIAGYRRWNEMFRSLGGDKLPGLQEGLRLVQRDERRHIAYGTYLCRRIIAEHPHLWEFVEQRWAKMAGPLLAETADPVSRSLAQRRLEVLAVARGRSVAEIESSSVEELEPEI